MSTREYKTQAFQAYWKNYNRLFKPCGLVFNIFTIFLLFLFGLFILMLFI